VGIKLVFDIIYLLLSLFLITIILRVVTKFPSGRIFLPIIQFKIDDFPVEYPPKSGILNFFIFFYKKL